MATIAERVSRIVKECAGVWGQSGIDSREQGFLESIKTRTTLSPKQDEWLQRIEKKAFPDETE
jgi:hypothetical protein